MLRTVSDLESLSNLKHSFQDSDQVTKFVIGIVRAFLMKHGFAKDRIDTTYEEGIRVMLNPPPAQKKRKHDWEEAQLATESSFAQNTTGTTKGGISHPSIDLIEYTKRDGATVTYAVRASAAQSRSSLHYPYRILLWIERKTYSGSIRGLIGLTKSTHALELQSGFVKNPQAPFLPLRRAMLA